MEQFNLISNKSTYKKDEAIALRIFPNIISWIIQLSKTYRALKVYSKQSLDII